MKASASKELSLRISSTVQVLSIPKLTTAIAVVRRTENGDHILFMGPIKPLHNELVRSRYQVDAICVIELLRDVLSKRIPCPSRRDSPTTPIVWVGPQQVAHGPFMRHLAKAKRQTQTRLMRVSLVYLSRLKQRQGAHLLHPIQRADMLQCVKSGRQASMQAEYLYKRTRTRLSKQQYNVDGCHAKAKHAHTHLAFYQSRQRQVVEQVG